MLLLQTLPTFEMDALTTEILDKGVAFLGSDIVRMAMGIFFLCFFFHLMEGAMELVQGAVSCRLFRMTFWMRILFTLTLLIAYKPVVIETARTVMPAYMLSLGTQWGNMFETQVAATDKLRVKAVEERGLRNGQVETALPENHEPWYAKASRYIVDGVITALAYLFGVLAGLLITVLVLFEGFMVLGVLTLVVAFGPLCVAFLAHEQTEGFFWAFFKAWLVYGLLYIPALNLGVTLAGVVLKHMTTFMAAGISVSGDWSDIGIHLLLVLIGPFCAYAMVRAVPAFMSMIFQTGVVGTGAQALGIGAQALARTLIKARRDKQPKDKAGSGIPTSASAAVSFSTSNGGASWGQLGSSVRGDR